MGENGFLEFLSTTPQQNLERHFRQIMRKKTSQEDKLIGTGHHRKMTSKKDKHTRREPYKKTGKMPYRKKTSKEFNLTG